MHTPPVSCRCLWHPTGHGQEPPPFPVRRTCASRLPCTAVPKAVGKPWMMSHKVTRSLHSQELNRSKYERLSDLAARCGQVRMDAWRRCRGVSTALQSPSSAISGRTRATPGTVSRRAWARRLRRIPWATSRRRGRQPRCRSSAPCGTAPGVTMPSASGSTRC